MSVRHSTRTQRKRSGDVLATTVRVRTAPQRPPTYVRERAVAGPTTTVDQVTLRAASSSPGGRKPSLPPMPWDE